MSQISLGPFANFNSAVPWGLWVAIYIWLVGISAGSFLLVSWGVIKNNSYLQKIKHLGLNLSLATLLVGLVSILIDLGHIERFFKLFISPSPTSVMAWMVWLYNFYALILVFLLLRSKKITSKLFFWFSLIFAFAIILIESLLFSMPPGKHWHSLIFPIHFLTSSLVSAIAALIFMVGILWVKDKRTELLQGLSKIALPLIIINLIVEIIDVISLGSISHIESWVLLLGNIIAIALLRKHSPVSITAAGCIELMDVLLSKYNSLISGQIVEPFKGFAGAYIEPRLQFSYVPSIFEYLVSIFLIGLAASLFYFLYKVLPLTREE